MPDHQPLAELGETELNAKQQEALASYIKEPNYAAVGRHLGLSRGYARRLVREAMAVRLNEILPYADEYIVLAVEKIESRLVQLEAMITRNEVRDDDGYVITDDILKAMTVERGYLSDLIKLLGIAAPEKHLVAVVPARPLTEAERMERIAKWQTNIPLLEDHGTSTDRSDSAGRDNGRPVEASSGQ